MTPPAVPIAILFLICAFSPPSLADREDGLMEIRQLMEGVYLHTSYGRLPGGSYYPSNGLVIVEQGRAWIVDTPWASADTPKLLAWIERRGLTPVASISTHFHDDRSSGIGYLNERDVLTHAHRRTNRLLAGQDKPLAARDFDGEHFSLLRGRIEVFYPGPGHSPDNVVVWLPRERLLFGGCLVRALASSGMGNTADGSLVDWPHSVQRVIDAFPAVATVVPGHGPEGGPELLEHTRELALR